MGIIIFTAQAEYFSQAAADVERQADEWLAKNPGLEVVSAQPTHVGHFDDMGVTHHYSLAVTYK